jgi:N-dimethylarginine dimethylaminohydrolase
MAASLGYGFRASKETVTALRTLLTEVYNSYGVTPPTVLGVKLKSANFYHLDMAMLAYSPTGAIVQDRAFSPATVERLRQEIGTVTVIQTEDRFALNAIVEQDKLICHVLKDDALRERLVAITGLPLVECDVSEFEKSGGSIRCLVFDVFDPRIFKRKNPSKTPTSPTSPRH